MTKVRESEEASAVSDGLEGKSEGNADAMRVGDISRTLRYAVACPIQNLTVTYGLFLIGSDRIGVLRT